MKKRYQFKNRIWIIAASVLVALTTTLNVQAAVFSSVALEQQVRCGLEEHIHTQECYLDELLVCTKKAHTHSENCYLLLLEENNVNALLGTIETAEDNSLDTLIADVVNDAILYEDSALSAVPAASTVAEAWQRSGASSSGGWTFFTSASSASQAGAASSTAVYAANTEGQVLEADIALLNENIVAANIQPYMVLNTGLTTMALTPEDTEPIGGIATLSLGQDPVTGTRKINFYIRLDGKLTCIGDGTLTYAYPAYYSFSDTASLYQKFLKTALTENNINQTYYFRYVSQRSSASPPTSFNSFNTYAGTRNSTRLTFGNSTNTRYAVLSWYGYNNSTDPVDFYTLNLNYTANGVAAADSAVYVEESYTYTLPESDDYYWVNANGDTVTSVTLTQATTVYAKPRNVTVTYLNGVTNATLDSFTLSPGASHPIDPNRVLPQGHIWIDESGNRVTAASITVRKDTVFRSVPATYTVTYLTADGTQYAQQTADYGRTIPLPNLPPGTSFWVDSGGGTYSAGDQVTVTKDLTFTAAARTMTVRYDVNFPTGSTGYYGAVYPDSPTVAGTTATTADYTVAQGSAAVVRDVSDRMLSAPTTKHGTEVYPPIIFYYPTYFQGWQTESGELVSPGTNLGWDALSAYDWDRDGTVELKGTWSSAERQNVANFCIAYNSELSSSGGNKDLYTPSLFATFVGGNVDTSYKESAEEGAAAYEADQRLRAMTGVKSTGMWFYEFPSDEYIFQQLKNYVGALYVDGELVETDELSADYYTIRWSVMFYNSEDGWHIDGRLVKRTGQITIDKEFLGDEAAIAAAEKDFYITASNGDNTRSHTFGLSNAVTADTASHHYEWRIEDVDIDEVWTITEHTGPVTVYGTRYICYPEYSVRDSDGNSTAIAEFGTTASVIGKTYALDEDPDQGLMVDFRNYYYPEDSMLLKKEDAATGQPIGNVTFRLYQPNEVGALLPLKFTMDPNTGQYIWDADNGTVEMISTGETGYSSLRIAGFSFAKPVYIEEVNYPTGYLPAPRVTIGQSGDKVVVQGVEGVEEAKWSDYAEFVVENSNLVAVIKNHTGVTTSLTVEKEWEPVDAAEDSVTVVLQANGSRATNLFPALSDVEVTLSGDNSWTHTWKDLPCYAGGTAVEWGVQEIKIGSTPTLADGKSFANWIATVTLLSSPDDNGDGVVDAWNYRVSNTPRRTMIRVTKTDEGGAVLPGATFTLVECDKSGTPVSGAATDTQVSDTNGLMTFDNLTAGHYYLLTETQPPGGYLKLLDSIILTVDGDGLVRQIKDGLSTDLTQSPVIHTGAYHIQVQNRTTQPLPETGGGGTSLYICSGLMLMLTAAGALWYKNKHRKEGQAPP